MRLSEAVSKCSATTAIKQGCDAHQNAHVSNRVMNRETLWILSVPFIKSVYTFTEGQKFEATYDNFDFIT